MPTCLRIVYSGSHWPRRHCRDLFFLSFNVLFLPTWTYELAKTRHVRALWKLCMSWPSQHPFPDVLSTLKRNHLQKGLLVRGLNGGLCPFEEYCEHCYGELLVLLVLLHTAAANTYILITSMAAQPTTCLVY
ncbi:hypothetical protein V8C37DRAFT_369261 [Trichoderma ceciliae]